MERLFVSKAKSVGVEAEQVQQRRVVVEVMNHIFDRLVPQFVRRTVNVAAFEAAAGDPHAEAVCIVIAPDSRWARVVLDDRQPTHFAAPVNDGRIEQTALLQILDQCGRGNVDLLARRRQPADGCCRDGPSAGFQ